MTDAKSPVPCSEARSGERRVSLLYFLGSADVELPPAGAAAAVTRLLGVYTDAESAERATHGKPSLPLPAALESRAAATPRVPAAAARRDHRVPRAARHRPQRARGAGQRVRRTDPTKGVRSLRAYRHGPRRPRPLFTRHTQKQS